jgi:hypothetical protein
MRVGRKSVERNLGFDPIAKPPPATTFAFAPALKASNIDDLRRVIIDFDSESPAGLQFTAFSTATGLSRFTNIPWPKGGSKPCAVPLLAGRVLRPHRHVTFCQRPS